MVLNKRILYRRVAIISALVVSLVMILSSSAQVLEMSTADNLSPAAAAAGNVTFTMGWTGTLINTLNPFTFISELTFLINSNIYLKLINFNTANDTVLPSLATSWNVNYGNHTVIFHLNPKAVWSDGQPVTSQDVIYSMHIAMAPYSFISGYTTPIQNITALNNKTVMFTISGTLWQMFAGEVSIVPYHIWKNVNASTYVGYNANGSTYFVGDGPFLLTKYVPNQYAEVQKNPDWFEPNVQPKIDTVIFREFSDASSAVSSLESGEIQGLANILPADLPTFQNNSAYTVSVSPPLKYEYLSIDVQKGGSGNPTLRNVTVRQAMAHAINYTYLAKTVYHGYAVPIASVFTPGNIYYDHSISPYSYNVTLANNMLNAAGFKMGSNGVRVSPNGTELKYTLLTIATDTLPTQMADLIAQNLTAIGIKTTVLAETVGSMEAQIWLANGTLGHDMDLWDWEDDTPYSPYLLSPFLTGQVATGVSDAGFNNSSYDSLWNQMLTVNSPSQALNLSYQMQQILHFQLPYIPLVAPNAVNVWSSSFTNINASFLGGPFGGLDYETFLTATPVGAKKPASSNLVLYIVIIAVVAIILIALAVVFMVRSRKKSGASP